jgi:hypothetical protein
MIPFTAIEYADGMWTYSWATGLGEVRVVLWGVELATTTESSYTYTSALYNSDTLAPPIEVVLAGTTLALSEQNLCFLQLQWYREECDHYDVEYYNGTSWVSQGSIADDATVFIFTYSTPLLVDMAESRWRVTAVAATKRESSPLVFQYMIVRPPNPPAMPTVTCDGGTLSVG